MIDPNAFGRGLQQGQGFVDGITNNIRRNQQQGAFSQYAMNPNDPNAINALARVDPEMALKARAQQAQTAQRQQEFTAEQQKIARENIIRGAQIVRQIQPKDQASWTQARATAQRLGIDVTQVPQEFDPQYVQGLIAAADAFEPQKAEASPYQIITPQPGAGAFRVDKRTGTTETLVAPNDGSRPMGAAVEGPASNVPKVSNQATYDAIPAGQQYMAPDGTIRVKPGGQSQPATGGFPGD